MNKLIPLILIPFTFLSCKKKKKQRPLWVRTPTQQSSYILEIDLGYGGIGSLWTGKNWSP